MSSSLVLDVKLRHAALGYLYGYVDTGALLNLAIKSDHFVLEGIVASRLQGNMTEGEMYQQVWKLVYPPSQEEVRNGWNRFWDVYGSASEASLWGQ